MHGSLDRALAHGQTELQPENAVSRRLRHLNIVPQPPAALLGAPGESHSGRASGLEPRWGLLGLHIADATNPGALS
jgi:hypothetical protein